MNKIKKMGFENFRGIYISILQLKQFLQRFPFHLNFPCRLCDNHKNRHNQLFHTVIPNSVLER